MDLNVAPGNMMEYIGHTIRVSMTLIEYLLTAMLHEDTFKPVLIFHVICEIDLAK